MISVDEDALTCDLAETYGIYDMRALPVSTLAVLADGLSSESRIKSKITGDDVGLNTLLLANLNDVLSLFMWSFTADAQKGRNRPPSLTDRLLHRETSEETNNDLETYKTPDEFMSAWAKLGGGV
ncbi:MAG: DUF5361 domain-containing protein [Clostridia bacterium]|nr:DUF5361 domain-containing protein [Clostridia bacterium]